MKCEPLIAKRKNSSEPILDDARLWGHGPGHVVSPVQNLDNEAWQNVLLNVYEANDRPAKSQQSPALPACWRSDLARAIFLPPHLRSHGRWRPAQRRKLVPCRGQDIDQKRSKAMLSKLTQGLWWLASLSYLSPVTGLLHAQFTTRKNLHAEHLFACDLFFKYNHYNVSQLPSKAYMGNIQVSSSPLKKTLMTSINACRMWKWEDR